MGYRINEAGLKNSGIIEPFYSNKFYKEKMLQLSEMVLNNKNSVSVYNWMYEDGVLLEGLLQEELLTGDSRVFPYIEKYLESFVTEDGHLPKIENRPSSVDCLNNAKIIYEAYKRTGKEKYKKVLEYVYQYIKKHPRLTGTSAFAHKMIYFDQMWLDGLYMLQPLYARIINDFGTKEDYSDVAKQFEYIFKFTFNEEKELFYHAYDHSRKMFWSDEKTGCSSNFWGRAMGWLGVALVDTLEAIPKAFEEERQILLNVLEKFAKGVIRWQNEKGVWYQILDKGNQKGNYIESSCSCMFAHTLLKAVRLKFLPKDYRKFANKAMEGIFNEFVTEDDNGDLHIHNVCLVAGLGPDKRPERDGSFEYYISEKIVDDDNKARGPFLLALTEMVRCQ